nr:TonB-dependent receptor [Bacteroidota bacterium]
EVRIRSNISTAYRPPHVSELYSEGLHHGSATVERGDPALQNERSLKAVLDLEAKVMNKRLMLALTGYHDRISDYIYLRPSGQVLTIRGAFPMFDHTATDGILNGVDAMIEFALIGNWHIRSRASGVRGEDTRAGGPLYMMPSDRIENALIFRQKEFRKWKDIEVELNSLRVFQQRRYVEGVDLLAPPAGYHLLGFSIGVSRPVGKNELRFGLSGTNLLNVPYRDILDRFRYFADARGADVTIWVRYAFARGNKE